MKKKTENVREYDPGGRYVKGTIFFKLINFDIHKFTAKEKAIKKFSLHHIDGYAPFLVSRPLDDL
jgi:hypothetical protein